LIYSSEGNADGTQMGSVLVTRTQDSGEYDYQPVHAFARVMQEQNVADPAVVSVGTNEPDYNNIVNAQPIGDAAGCIELPLVEDWPVIGPETDIFVKVETPCVAEPETIPTLEFRIVLVGANL
jgi:hypothetical protein